MAEIDETLRELGFDQAMDVRGRASIADLCTPGRRCGFYVLLCADGEQYAGKAIDVTRRYVQHRKVHPDIAMLVFKPVPKERLYVEEPRLIQTLEARGFLLRNVQFTNFPLHASDLDSVVPLAEQEQWLQDVRYRNLIGSRVVSPTQRRKYTEKFEQLRRLPYAEEAVQVLRKYIQTGILSPLSTEMSFWCCTCRPPYRRAGTVIYSRVCIHAQEVFTVGTHDRVPFFSWHLAQSPLAGVLERLCRQYSLFSTDDLYQPGGTDQLGVEIEGAVDKALAFLDEPHVVRAIRRFNLALMRKGPSLNSHYHCMDLADRLLETMEE